MVDLLELLYFLLQFSYLGHEWLICLLDSFVNDAAHFTNFLSQIGYLLASLSGPQDLIHGFLDIDKLTDFIIEKFINFIIFDPKINFLFYMDDIISDFFEIVMPLVFEFCQFGAEEIYTVSVLVAAFFLDT